MEYNETNHLWQTIQECIPMNKKKTIIISIVVVLVLIVGIVAGLVINHMRRVAEEAERLRIYNETYLVMDGVEYLRASTELDLSGQQITELEKLQELTALQHLDLRNTGITTAQYDMLHAALPQCEILWSVPFQGDYLDSTSTELVLETLAEEDLAAFPYLPQLTSINADQCRDYEPLLALIAQYPELTVTYTVPIGDNVFAHTVEDIIVTNPAADDLLVHIPLLPCLKTVTLEGALPSNQELIEVKETFPDVTFLWNFTVCGVQTNSLAEFIDLSKIDLGNTEELEAALPCFYNLTKVDMISCGISDPDMEALNLRHPETSFVWKVKVSGINVRTDIKYFMPWKHNIKKVGNLYNLRYCTDIEVLDFGHRGIYDVSYIEYMPNLRFLLLLECTPDMNIIGNCTSLEYLELCDSPVTDFWPLTNLTNLKDLNLSYTPLNLGSLKFGTFGDITPLLQMTWLDRLWMAFSRIGEDGRALMRESLPNTEMVFISTSSTDRGWRYSPRYYEMRDILEMWYMVH